jgi:hypothetical protein
MTEEKKDSRRNLITRRDFLKGATCAGLATAVGLPVNVAWASDETALTRVVLIREKEALDDTGNSVAAAIKDMLDRAVSRLYDTEDPSEAWRKVAGPDDIVGIKSNDWGPRQTPPVVEEIIEKAVMGAGVDESNISVNDRGVLYDPVFQKATALINVRPMRAHHWAGVGGLLKNYIMFVPEPSDYHGNSCADLAAIWKLPIVNGKTRLNILIMLSPQFHCIGPHHFDETYTWEYKGILVGTDPVAVDATGLRILEAEREIFFGEKKPLKPPAHHIAYADIRHGLGTSDPAKIELVKLGWQEGILI